MAVYCALPRSCQYGMNVAGAISQRAGHAGTGDFLMVGSRAVFA